MDGVVASYSMCGCVHTLGKLLSQAGTAWCAGIGKSHMAGLVVAQLLLKGRVVLLELVLPVLLGSANRCYYRMQLRGESPTRLSSWRAERALQQHHCQRMVTDCFFLLCRWGCKRA